MIVGAVTLVTFAITLILLQTVSGIGLISGDYIRLLMIMVATLFYLAIFAAVGTIASIKLHHSSTSLTVLLFLWFLVAILQPNVSTYLASELKTVPRLEDIKPTLDVASDSYLQELERLQTQYETILNDPSKRKLTEGVTSWGRLMMYTAMPDADYEILQYAIKQTQIYRKSVGAADREWQLYKSLYLDKLDRQLEWKRLIDLISPAALFTHAAAVLSRTEIDNFEDFMNQVREFRTQYIAYLDGKGVFSSNARLFFSRLTREQIDPRETERRLAQYAKDPSTISWIRDQSPLDLTDSPMFRTQAYAVLDDVGKASRALFLLILYAVVLLALSGWGLRAYDVR
jgi:ABC-type transport system involved in multi-copper enzyme maturation permease subunit